MAAHPTTREYELETLWASRGVDRAAFIWDDDGTILDHSDGQSREPSAVPKLTTLGSGDTLPEVALGDTIGQGAMGIVRRARQLALPRDVAVKTIRPHYLHVYSGWAATTSTAPSSYRGASWHRECGGSRPFSRQAASGGANELPEDLHIRRSHDCAAASIPSSETGVLSRDRRTRAQS